MKAHYLMVKKKKKILEDSKLNALEKALLFTTGWQVLSSHLIQTVCYEDKTQEKASLKNLPHCSSLLPSHNFSLTEQFAAILETGERNVCRKHHT